MVILGARINPDLLDSPGYIEALQGYQSLTVCLQKNGRPRPVEAIEKVKEEFPDTPLLGHYVLSKRDAYSFAELSDLTFFVSETFRRYQGLIDEWNILNEILNDGEVCRDIFSDPDWPLHACEAARKAAPDALLWYNEYALRDKVYWTGVISLAERLDGLIDGVGIQIHTDLRGSTGLKGHAKFFSYGRPFLQSMVTEKRLKAQCDRIRDLGLKIHLSEVSIRANDKQKEAQKKLYARYLKMGEEMADRFTYWWVGNQEKDCLDGQPGI